MQMLTHSDKRAIFRAARAKVNREKASDLLAHKALAASWQSSHSTHCHRLQLVGIMSAILDMTASLNSVQS